MPENNNENYNNENNNISEQSSNPEPENIEKEDDIKQPFIQELIPKTGIIVFVIALIANIVISVVIGFLVGFIYRLSAGTTSGLNPVITSKAFLTVTILITYTFMSYIMYRIIKKRNLSRIEVFKLKQTDNKKLYLYPVLIIVGIHLFLLIAAYASLIMFKSEGSLNGLINPNQMLNPFIGQSILDFILLAISVVILPAIIEELFFRGLIQKSFRNKLTPVPTIFLTALLFGVFHLEPVRIVITFF
ncbi:MAG: CPBP family intramembrane glutamic endopeptidase, partial [Spirochaetota bacterium]